MNIPGFKKTGGEIVKSKAMIGGLITVIMGCFFIYKGQYEMGATQVGLGLSIMGLRDAV